MVTSLPFRRPCQSRVILWDFPSTSSVNHCCFFFANQMQFSSCLLYHCGVPGIFHNCLCQRVISQFWQWYSSSVCGVLSPPGPLPSSWGSLPHSGMLSLNHVLVWCLDPSSSTLKAVSCLASKCSKWQGASSQKPVTFLKESVLIDLSLR